MRLWRKRDPDAATESLSPGAAATTGQPKSRERQGLRRPSMPSRPDLGPGAVERLRSGRPEVEDIPTLDLPDVPDSPEIDPPLNTAD